MKIHLGHLSSCQRHSETVRRWFHCRIFFPFMLETALPQAHSFTHVACPVHSAPILTKSNTACPPPSALSLSKSMCILLDCNSWRQTHIVSVSLNIPWIWFLHLLNRLFSRCWDKSMARLSAGKATCQKWTARLHVRSVHACVHALSPSKQRLIPGSGPTVTTALFGQSNSATIFKSLRGQVYPNTVRNEQDILEKFRLVTSVKFLRREGSSIDGKKTRSCHPPPRIDHPSII